MALVFADAFAYALGNVAGTYNISGSNNQLSITIDGGGAQVFTLTSGAARTAAQIVADLAGLTSATASVITIGTLTYVQIKTTSSNNNSSTILINAPASNANATLGFIATTYKGGIVTDGATSTGVFTGATKQNITDGLEAALLDAGWITISGHGTGTLVMQCSVTPGTAGSLICQITVKTANTNCTSISIQNISGTKASTNSATGGGMLLPAAAKVFKVVACKHQFFIFTAAPSTAREYAAAGVLYVPSFMQGPSGVYEAIWLQGNAVSDTDSTSRVSFRTALWAGGSNATNQASILNGSLSEMVNNAFAPGGANNDGVALQRLAVSVEGARATGPYQNPAWHDGSFDTIDPVLIFGMSSLSDQGLRRGLLWNAGIVMASFTGDLTDTLNSHNWWFLTHSNAGSSTTVLPGTLILATS